MIAKEKEVIQMGRFLFGVNYYTLLFILLSVTNSVVSVIQSYAFI